MQFMVAKGTNSQSLSRFPWHEECLGVLLLPPGWDVSLAGLPPAVCCPYQFIHVHLGKVRQSGVKFLVYRNNANGMARKPGPLDPDFHV